MSCTRDLLVSLLGSSILALAPAAEAQQAGKSARVGWVDASYDAKPTPRPGQLQGLVAGLRELGWVEGKNLVMDVRVGDGSKAAEFATELVRNKADVIFVAGPMARGVMSQAGATPIVFGMTGDPVEMKFVVSLARPGGNFTGLTSLALEFEGKRLELLKEIVPRITRVAVLANSQHPGYSAQLNAAQAAAKKLGLSLQIVPVQAPGDFDAAFEVMTREGAEAIHTFPDGLIHRQARLIAEYGLRRRIPTIGGWLYFVEVGNLLSFGPSEYEFYRRAASYVDRILRGAKPADLPIELPTRYELMVNKATANALGLALPASILLRAEKVIE